MASKNRITSTKKHHAVFEALHHNEQRLLQLLAIVYEPVPATRLYQCVTQLAIKDSDNRKYTHRKLKETLEFLSLKELLEKFGGKFVVNSIMTEPLCRLALSQGCFQRMAESARKVFPLTRDWRHVYFTSAKQCFSEIRMAVYKNNIKEVNSLIIYYADAFALDYQQQDPVAKIFFQPFDAVWFSRLSGDMLSLAISGVFNEANSRFAAIDSLLEWLLNAFQTGTITQAEQLAFRCAGQYLLRGNMESANVMSQFSDDYHRLLLAGWQQFIQGKNPQALDSFTAAIALSRKVTGKRKVVIDNPSSVFFILALIKSGDPQRLQQARDYSILHRKQKQHSDWSSHQVLARVLDFLFGIRDEVLVDSKRSWLSYRSTTGYLLHCYFVYWSDMDQTGSLDSELMKFAAAAEKSHSFWLASEAWQLLAKITDKGDLFQRKADNRHQQDETQSIIHLIKPKAKWQQTLDAITLFRKNQEVDSSSKATRMVWFISNLSTEFPELQPKEQKRTVKGGWSKGRNISLRRFKEDPHSFNNLCSQDHAVCSAIIKESYGHYNDFGGYELDVLPAMYALTGHPHLFDAEDPGKRLELVAAEPEIRIHKQREQLLITMEPEMGFEDIVLSRETSSRWKVIRFSQQHQQLSQLIGEGLKVPSDAKDQVLTAMAAVAPLVNIQSDIGGELVELETVKTDSSLHVLLSPSDDGIVIETHSRVFGNRGPYYPPGQGSETIISEIDGKRLQTKRDLVEEQHRLDVVLESCPSLALQEQADQHWFINEPEDCLEILTELQAIKDQVTIAWPKGEKFRIKQQLSMHQLSLNVEGSRDWFCATGELQLDDGEVLNMQRLLSLNDNARGRFIKLEDGQFLALSKTFSKRLNELRMFGEVKGDALQLHPLAALTLDDIVDEVGKLKAGKHWQQFRQRFDEAMSLQPEVPSTLQAELRDYQQEGFRWLARLAHWGGGACLADDMGLGKTLQALAIILHRTMNGPSLVIAPTSVALNWMDEIQRFAPTLNIIDFRDTTPDIGEQLQPFDILISSYGLLQNRIEQLKEIDWQNIVLDEAQAIKNPATKRSQAVMKLSGQFKLITTGTPIENHLGELWNLFRFINPGLLGSLKRFNQRFALPISRDRNPDASQQLKKLIQPFILRRTKTQVLEELPARTEIVLNIEMSQDEANLYEALRREALEKFAAESATAKKGHRQLQILAEITRLRQACCNPQLVIKQGAPASSKLAQFSETLDELLQNHHKALVFSQFVGHLKILEHQLKDKGISYQYLDGATPVKERKRRVSAFQAGEGDIFLISLKAGGVGLNLTAADYVIHMDPWWNPAVEDQASDRAHRIGQSRPVTVYRMVMKNTIEEQIIALHEQKRDLADNLLAGTNVADKLSAEDLLALLKEE